MRCSIIDSFRVKAPLRPGNVDPLPVGTWYVLDTGAGRLSLPSLPARASVTTPAGEQLTCYVKSFEVRHGIPAVQLDDTCLELPRLSILTIEPESAP